MPLRLSALLVFLVGLSACDTVGLDLPPEPEAGVQAWDEMLTAVNAVRAEGATCGDRRMAPAAPLIWDSRLEAAAERHSRDMAEHGHFDHRGSDGLGTGERVRRAGYDWRVIGENIAARQQSVAEVVGDWVESEGHCLHLMDPGFQEIGAAEVEGYWTQVFGVPR